MHFHFDQTMYGTFREIKAGGRSGRFDFTCRAVGDAETFPRDRLARLGGTAALEGVADAAPMEGTLKIDPIFGRELVYDFAFRVGGELFRFLGRKTIDFTRPVSSMTTLVGRIDRDGVAWADVDSRFRLPDLLGLLASFRVGL